jgi:hypothetical protein
VGLVGCCVRDDLVKIETLRVAFFPDSYHEIDGVANTSRHFEAFARQRGLPEQVDPHRASTWPVESVIPQLQLAREP